MEETMRFFIRIWVFAIGILGGISFGWAQDDLPRGGRFVVKVIDGNNPGDTVSLTAGTDIHATYGIDTSLGEREAQQPSPDGFYAFWIDPRVELYGSSPYGNPNISGPIAPYDLRSPGAAIDTFEIRFRSDTGASSRITLHWGRADLLDGRYRSLVLHDAVTDGVIYNVDMFTSDSLKIANKHITEVSIYLTLWPDGVRDEKNVVPEACSLSQNFPNPFNPSTMIDYQLPRGTFVTLKVYDLLGREVATLASGFKQAGYYAARFFGDGLPSGVYFYKMTAGKFNDIKKFLLLK